MRALFGGDLVVLSTAGSLRANNRTLTATFWDSEVGGIQQTDLLAADGTTPVSALTVTGATLPAFYGPDGVLTLWCDLGDGTRELIRGVWVEAVAGGVTDAQVAEFVTAGGPTTQALDGVYATDADAAALDDRTDTLEADRTALDGRLDTLEARLGTVTDFTGTPTAAAFVSGSVRFRRLDAMTVAASGYVDVDTDIGTGYVATGIVVPAELRPPTQDPIYLGSYYNSTGKQYRYRVQPSTGALEFQQSGVDPTFASIPGAIYFLA